MRGIAATPNTDRPMLGITFMLLTYLLFSFLDASVKWLAIAGLPALQIAFMRYAGHFVISLLLILKGGLSFSRFDADNLGLVILRGLLLMLSTVFNFFALRYLPLTLTSTIMFSAPIIVCALSGPMLGERVGIWRWLAIVAGFIGVMVAVRPFDETFHWAVLLSITNVTFYSLYKILTRKLSGKVAIDTLQFYAGAVGTFVLLPFAIYSWQMPSHPMDWALLAVLGFFGWSGHELLTRAHGHAEASILTPFTYVFIVYMTAWSYLVFDHAPDVWTIAGAVIVIASGLFIWLRERKLGIQRLAAVRG